jgi:hypothetical protein
MQKRGIITSDQNIGDSSSSLTERLIWNPLRRSFGWVIGRSENQRSNFLIFPHLLQVKLCLKQSVDNEIEIFGVVDLGDFQAIN